MSATRVTRGAICLSASSHLVPIENSKLVKPVMFPAGRARLATKPLPTGSVTCTNMIGTPRPCSRRAAITGVLVARIRSGGHLRQLGCVAAQEIALAHPAILDPQVV